MSEFQSGVTATIKAHGGYDAPWIVFHGTDAEHLSAMIDEAQRESLVDKVADISNQFGAVELIKRELGAVQVAPQGGPQSGHQGQQQAPQAAQGGYNRQGPPQGGQQAPQGPPASHDLATHCRHGEKVYMSGISAKTNKPWFGFDCPANYKTNECARFAKANG